MAAEHPKFCPHCGTAVVGTMKFCTSCGKSVVAEAQQYTAPAPSKKKSPAWAYILITLLFLWGGWQFLLAPGIRQAETMKAYDVTYHISGTARTADLTYQNAGSNTEQQNDEVVPWIKSFTGHGGQFLYVSAQNQGATGTITCKIILDGVVVKSSESSGAYAIASCSGKI
jgi:hypothetical protein